jgi:hypothetical protein
MKILEETKPTFISSFLAFGFINSRKSLTNPFPSSQTTTKKNYKLNNMKDLISNFK